MHFVKNAPKFTQSTFRPLGIDPPRDPSVNVIFDVEMTSFWRLMTSFYHYTRKNLNVNIKTCGSLQKLRNEKLSAKCTIFETLWRHLHVKMTSKWRQNDVIDKFFHNIFFLSKNYHNIPNFAEFNSDSDLIRKLRFKVSSLKDISICLHSSINVVINV